MFAYSLLKAVEAAKKELRELDDNRTEQQEKQYEVLAKRGAQHLLVAGISGCLSTLLQKPMSNRFAFSFKDGTDLDQAIAQWGSIVKSLLPLSPNLSIGIDSGIKDKTSNRQAIDAFGNQVATITAMYGLDSYSDFASSVVEN